MSYVDVELKKMRIVIGKRKKDETEEQGQDATLSVVKSLMSEEVCLTEQRDELLTLRGGLQLQAKERIETVTSSIQKLKNEVSELRLQCEQLKEFISNSK
jgi:pyridoxine 5'-phosphate synthase PdxJ